MNESCNCLYYTTTFRDEIMKSILDAIFGIILLFFNFEEILIFKPISFYVSIGFICLALLQVHS